MRISFSLLAAAAGLVLATSANAVVVVFNPSSGPKNDFEITTDGPITIKQTLTGLPFTQTSTNPPPYTYKSSGWSVGGAGSGSDSLTLNGLTFDKLTNIAKAGKSQVTSWCWSVNGTCNPADAPYVKVSTRPGTPASNYTLQGLQDAGYGITVPEPAAWALMISGFGLVGSALRRRRRGFASA